MKARMIPIEKRAIYPFPIANSQWQADTSAPLEEEGCFSGCNLAPLGACSENRRAAPATSGNDRSPLQPSKLMLMVSNSQSENVPSVDGEYGNPRLALNQDIAPVRDPKYRR